MKYMHLRFGDLVEGKHIYDPRGGMTFAWEATDEGLSLGIGVCSLNDNFCRRIGRSVAKGREFWKWSKEDFKKEPTDKEIATQLANQFTLEDGFLDYEAYENFLKNPIEKRIVYLDV